MARILINIQLYGVIIARFHTFIIMFQLAFPYRNQGLPGRVKLAFGRPKLAYGVIIARFHTSLFHLLHQNNNCSQISSIFEPSESLRYVISSIAFGGRFLIERLCLLSSISSTEMLRAFQMSTSFSILTFCFFLFRFLKCS